MGKPTFLTVGVFLQRSGHLGSSTARRRSNLMCSERPEGGYQCCWGLQAVGLTGSANHWEGFGNGLKLLLEYIYALAQLFSLVPLTRRSWKYSGHASSVSILSSRPFGSSLLEQLDTMAI